MAYRFRPIEAYAAIGDCRCVALVSDESSIDWLCLPHFSGPSVFAALLDRERGGRFALTPTGPFRASRRYVDETNVLETRFETSRGSVTVTDCVTMAPGRKHHDSLRPRAEVLRLVRGVEGEVELEALCDPRPDFGRVQGRFERRGRLGWAYAWRDAILLLRAEAALERRGDGAVGGRFRVSAGQTACFSLSYTRRDVAVVPVLGDEAVRRIDETKQFWQEWSSLCRAEGRYREPVLRSALALKLLHYNLSGAVIAAPTTSLPEVVGGVRNWDYRYCWLRDAALTFRAFVDIGYTLEADFFMDWLLHATRLTRPRLNVLYDVYGQPHVPEIELDHLEGYRGSQPVRTGNAAQDQLQLDIYGSLIQAAHDFVASGGVLARDEAGYLVGLGRQVCELWHEPDEGIWEKRSVRVHHTYSKIMCWVALDRLLRLAARGAVRAPVERFRQERDAIAEQVETRGFNKRLNSYVDVLDGDRPDASLILAARCGYRRPGDPRMQGTCELLDRRLGVDGMLYRYAPGTDGLPGEEGAFGAASFWAVEYLALAGRVDEGRRRFEKLLERSNDVGLFAEQFDPATGAALGNFPQAFTHVALIEAASALHRAERGRDTASGE